MSSQSTNTQRRARPVLLLRKTTHFILAFRQTIPDAVSLMEISEHDTVLHYSRRGTSRPSRRRGFHGRRDFIARSVPSIR